MKTFRLGICGGWFPFLSVIILCSGGRAFAQTAGNVPVVTVQATQPFATMANPGVFTVFRAGDTNAALNVWYNLGGSASNGVDYVMIPPHLVAIPAGATSNTIVITPLTNPSNPPPSLARTVILDLTNSPLLSPVNYEIGSPSQAVVDIVDTNFPSPIVIGSPKNGAIFYTPTNIPIAASVSYLEFPMPANVEFYAGTNDLGKGVTGVSSGFGGVIYLTWSNPPPGNFALAAVASYSGFMSETSPPVNISVLPGPATNLPPVVSLILPTNGETFTLPTSIEMLAKASDPDGTVTNVEFFAGTNDLGKGSPAVLDPPGVNGVTGLVYLFNWTTPLPGTYPVTAVATDNGGASTVSAPANITVLGVASNLPPIVRITSPPNGAVFRAPVNIPVFAYAADLGGTVASVQFFANSNSLGFGQHVIAVPPPLPPGPVQPPILIVQPSNYWAIVWTNAPYGTNIALTAQATTIAGASTVSAPVQISILTPILPPPTNRPAVVGIVASDPVAIEGTNCWPWLSLTNRAPAWSNWFAATAVFHLETNCGPKNATFTVFRIGATNNDLDVNYTNGGTARDGIDYAMLPGTVLIPAGEREAEVTIVPLDDGSTDVISTVVLKLVPGTNYVVGIPPEAAAIILDSQSPRATTGMLPGNFFNLSATGPNGAWFHVDYSTDMINWTPLCTNQVVNGAIDFVDPDAAGQPARFYRAVPEANAPVQ